MMVGDSILVAPPLPDLNRNIDSQQMQEQSQETTKVSTTTKENVQTVVIGQELGFDVIVNSPVIYEIMVEIGEHVIVQ